MTGYQEIFTDPSYFGQLMVTTNAHIGNYGVNEDEVESESPKIAGLICKNFNEKFSRPNANGSLQDFFNNHNLVAISDVDTRALVSYVRDNQLERVSASKCVLACNSNVIPFICSELPAKQKEALAFQVKVPILYTNVAVKNWQAWKNLGIGAMVCPGSYHIVSMLDFPVSYGDYQFSKNENEPIIVHMERFPHVYEHFFVEFRIDQKLVFLFQ